MSAEGCPAHSLLKCLNRPNAVPAYVQILGFPLEAASVLLLPYFGVKYLIDKDDVKDDIGNAVVSHLPPLVYNNCHGHCEPCLYVFERSRMYPSNHVYAWTEVPLAEPVWKELLNW